MRRLRPRADEPLSTNRVRSHLVQRVRRQELVRYQTPLFSMCTIFASIVRRDGRVKCPEDEKEGHGCESTTDASIENAKQLRKRTRRPDSSGGGGGGGGGRCSLDTEPRQLTNESREKLEDDPTAGSCGIHFRLSVYRVPCRTRRLFDRDQIWSSQRSHIPYEAYLAADITERESQSLI